MALKETMIDQMDTERKGILHTIIIITKQGSGVKKNKKNG